jgi:peroxiredoxin
VTGDPAFPSPDDRSGFRVLAADVDGRQLDTLGHARTGPEGHFRMPVSAPERGVYSLSLWGRRGEEQLAVTEYAVAPGDSGTLRVDLPLGPEESFRPESTENRALQGYRNAMTMHRRMLARRLQADAYRPTALAQNIRLTSSTLWSLSIQYPGTYAGQFAAVESLALLERWNDSLVVARARQIAPTSPHYVDAARIARRAEARRHGHRAARALVDSFQARADGPPRRTGVNRQAGVKAARIQAFLDSAQVDAALSAAQQLRANHSRSSWAQWARRVGYEAERLQSGMTAPNLTVQTLTGDTLSLRELRGAPVVLEYYQPNTDLFTLQHPLRNTLHETTRPDSVTFVSISVEPDSLANRAFLRSRRLPGRMVFAPDGIDDPIATRYNVVQVPTWILIDDAGKIVDQYFASDVPVLRQHLTVLLRENPTPVSPLVP